MKREWMVALGAVALGAMAVGGYWYVDRELRTAAATGLNQVNALYARWKQPPLTYERMETDVFSLSVTLHNLRQQGTLTVAGGEQAIDSVVARAKFSKARDRRVDVVLEGMKIADETRYPADTQNPQVKSVVTVEREQIDGLDLAALAARQPADPLSWIDRAVSRGIGGEITVRQPGATSKPQTIAFTAADAGVEPAENNLRRIFVNDVRASEPESINLGIRSLSIRLRPSDALGRLMEASEHDEESLRAILVDFGRSLAGFAINGVEVSLPSEPEPIHLEAASIDQLAWRDTTLTDLAFRVDHLKIGLPPTMQPDQRALFDAAGVKTLDQSMQFGLHYTPDDGAFRLAPVTSTTEGLVAISLTAGLDNLHLPKLGLGDAAQQQVAKMQMAAAMINAIPTEISAQIRDLGGAKKIVAALATQERTTVDAMLGQWATLLEMQAGGLMEPTAAAKLATDVRAFLTDKSTLELRVAPRGAISLAAMSAMRPDQAVAVTSSVE